MRAAVSACVVALCLLILSPQADARLRGPSVPPPAGCRAVSLREVLKAQGGSVCIHRVLVTTVANGEANATTFIVTDHQHTLELSFQNWWPQGPPTAGMVVTLWAHYSAGRWIVDRWIDLTHGTGASPDGPYQEASLMEASAGMIPEHRMVWVPVIPFALDPQDNGDGDIHVQTFSTCPAAGLTTEATPALRGYVDHPAVPGLTSTSDTSDQPHNHLADAPPVGVPVMVLGAVRYDYGFGWYEIHPIRAWHPLTAAELALVAQQCAAGPIPGVGPGPVIGGVTVPVPFGVPPCTDGSEFGTPPGFGLCPGPRCYVASTAVNQLEKLAGNCPIGVKPVRTPSQEGMPERLPGQGSGVVPTTPPSQPPGVGELEQERNDSVRYLDTALLAAYGPQCQRSGVDSGALTACAVALGHLAMEPITPRRACREVPAGGRAGCVAAGRRLRRRGRR